MGGGKPKYPGIFIKRYTSIAMQSIGKNSPMTQESLTDAIAHADLLPERMREDLTATCG